MKKNWLYVLDTTLYRTPYFADGLKANAHFPARYDAPSDVNSNPVASPTTPALLSHSTQVEEV
jgi:hypothetical protein